MKRILFFMPVLIFIFSSCKKDDDPAYDKSLKAELSVEFDNVAGESDLELNTGIYTNAANEQLTISKLKYFVSNFVLTNMDGSVYTVPQDSCYFLIDESDEETHEPVLNIPEGEYKTLTFTVGVDSARSTANANDRTGVLDPAGEAGDMYWNADAGYIFLKLEGNSPASDQPDNVFKYDVGGYSAQTINNLKTITLDLSARGTPKVKEGKETNIHLFVDVLKVFSGSENVSIANNPLVMFGSASTVIADNYAAMFRHDHTEN